APVRRSSARMVIVDAEDRVLLLGAVIRNGPAPRYGTRQGAGSTRERHHSTPPYVNSPKRSALSWT
ncbi:MAG TPA: hypothetical protein VMX11_04100, partial [Actinomycetes bacterium]|nr:hypothetical protein [Actinomycetes bacterium]